MKILIADFKKKRPWLDCDNGELFNVLKNKGNIELIIKTQLNEIELINEIKDSSYNLIVIHVEHQGINQAISIIDELKRNEHRIILYGYGVRFNKTLNNLKYTIVNNDIHKVVEYIDIILGTLFEYPYGKILGADYSNLNISSIFNYPIRYSKGCENSCPYCERSLEKIKEYRSAYEFEQELYQAVNKYSAKVITFLDSSLMGGNKNNRFMEDIVPILEKYNIRWRANGVTVTSIDDDKIELLRRSGCYLLSIGIESFSDGVKIGKKVDFEKIKRLLPSLKANNIYTIGFFICGLEGDTLEKSMDSLTIVKNIDIDICLFASAVALPETVLWNYVNKHGRFLCNISDTFPDKKNIIHFETDEFTANERIKFMKATEFLKEKNHRAIEQICYELGGPWSISERENIVWKV